MTAILRGGWPRDHMPDHWSNAECMLLFAIVSQLTKNVEDHNRLKIGMEWIRLEVLGPVMPINDDLIII